MERLRADLERLSSPLAGRVGVAVRDLRSNAEVFLHADEPFPLASVFKVPLMVAVLDRVDVGELRLDGRLVLGEQDKSPGGILTFCAAGLQPTVADLLFFMITQSDNTATDLLWRRIGLDAPTAVMRRLGLHTIDCFFPDRELFLLEVGACPTWRDLSPDELVRVVREARSQGRLAELLARVRGEAEDLDGRSFQRLSDARFGLAEELDYDRGFAIDQQLDNTGTPRDVLELLAMIAEDRCASPPSCRLMTEILCRQEWRDRIPAGLPEGLRIGNKTGSVAGTVNDAALIWRADGSVLVVVVFCKGLSRSASGRAPEVIAQMTSAVWNAFTEGER